MIASIDASLFATLAFRGWFPLWLAIAVAVVAFIGVTLLYCYEAKRVAVPLRIILGGLRILILCAILFLILRPTWLTEVRGNRSKQIAVLIDDSQSMTTRDPRPNPIDKWRSAIALDLVPPETALPENLTSTAVPEGTPNGSPQAPWPSRLDLAKKTLANPRLNLLQQLNERGPLQVASFGASRSTKDPRNPDWLSSFTGKQERTALVDAAMELLNRDENEVPAAIVIITDGRENASTKNLDQLARECQRLKVPLHVYGIGSSAFGQLQIRDVNVQDTLFADDVAAVPVRYRLKGFKEAKVDFIVKLNGREVVTKTVDAKDGDDLRELLTFTPEKKDVQAGKMELTTSVRIRSGDETFTDELAKSVRVIDRKLKILMVDSNPRWDFKFIQRGLLRDRRIEAKFMLTEGDPRAMTLGDVFIPKFPTTRPELFAYDLLILGDVPIATFSTEQQQWIREFVEEGGGMIHMAGRAHGPANYVGTPIGDILPVEVDSIKFVIDSGTRQEGFRPELTSAGMRSLMLSLDDNPVESLRIWRALPEMYWHYPVKKLKPGAEVFLVHPKEKTADNKPMPLMASHYFGKGYVMFAAFDETWRWRFNEADKYFYRFWSQVIYVGGVSRTLGTKTTQLSLDTPEAALGKTGTVYARLLSPDLKPLTAERIEARVERLDVDITDKDKFMNVELKALPGQPGEYIATIPFNRTGRFSMKVDNGTESGLLEYRVALPNDHEMAPGGLAEDEMRQLALATGGTFYREEDLSRMPETVKPKTTPFVQKQEILLWNVWAMVALICLFSLEWFIRKFNSMS